MAIPGFGGASLPRYEPSIAAFRFAIDTIKLHLGIKTSRCGGHRA